MKIYEASSDRYLGIWNPVSILGGAVAGFATAEALGWDGWQAECALFGITALAVAVRVTCILARPGGGISRLRGRLSRVKEER